MRSTVIMATLLLFLTPVYTLGKTAGTHRTEARDVLQVVKKTLNTLKKTQKMSDSWEKEKKGFVARYNSLKTEASNLTKQRTMLLEMIRSMENRIHEKKKGSAESYRVKDQIGIYLQSVVDQLADFIKHDLPFLPEERKKRITSLRHCLLSPDIPWSEKYRRVMEAVEVETGYGRTVEVYQDIIRLGKRQVAVDILRLGRLSLFFMTPDGKIAGCYERANRRWEPLAGSRKGDIKKAISIIRKERLAEIVRLPIGTVHTDDEK
ncbi:MAG: DUF3450 domain-containing protein [Deltaproteobacteria bacterium]|nr:DUF3450 domain-containing protein [Deltaproteobacteria bacterium]